MDDVLPGGQIIVACAAVSLTISASLCVASTVLLRAALLLCGGTVIGGVSSPPLPFAAAPALGLLGLLGLAAALSPCEPAAGACSVAAPPPAVEFTVPPPLAPAPEPPEVPPPLVPPSFTVPEPPEAVAEECVDAEEEADDEGAFDVPPELFEPQALKATIPATARDTHAETFVVVMGRILSAE